MTFGSYNDYKSLKIAIDEDKKEDANLYYEFMRKTIDLSDYFKDENGQTINLRSVFYHFFKKDIQNTKHESFEDAKATLRLYFELKKLLVTGQNPLDLPILRLPRIMYQ